MSPINSSREGSGPDSFLERDEEEEQSEVKQMPTMAISYVDRDKGLNPIESEKEYTQESFKE